MVEALGSRRRHLRFEITGQLWASLDVSAAITLRDLTTNGALVETPAGGPWSALRIVTLGSHAGALNVTGVVRHVTAASFDASRQLVGIEFVHVSDAARRELEYLVGQSAV